MFTFDRNRLAIAYWKYFLVLDKLGFADLGKKPD